MRQLDHPNIVQLIDFSESRQYYYIVLELCPGGELFHQIVRLTYFSEDLSRHVIVQVAEALEYLHETAGVVHRYGIGQSVDIPAKFPIEISNLRTCYFIQQLLYLPETRNLDLPKMRTKRMKESSSKASGLEVSERSR